MEKLYRRSGMALFAAVLFLLCNSATAQVGTSNTKTLNVKSATTTTLTYLLTVTDPEITPEAIIKAISSKTDIESCKALGNNRYEIITEPHITHDMLLGVIKSNGLLKTYEQYRSELIANKDALRAEPKQEKTNGDQ